jgi:hypothetical protein
MVRWEDKQMQEQTLIPRRRSKEETSLTLCVRQFSTFEDSSRGGLVDNASGQRHCVNAIMYLLTAFLFFFVPSDAEKNTLCYSDSFCIKRLQVGFSL